MLELEITEKVITKLVALLCNFVPYYAQSQRSLCCEFQWTLNPLSDVGRSRFKTSLSTKAYIIVLL